MWSASRNVAATRIAIGVTRSAAAHSSPPHLVASPAIAPPCPPVACLAPSHNVAPQTLSPPPQLSRVTWGTRAGSGRRRRDDDDHGQQHALGAFVGVGVRQAGRKARALARPDLVARAGHG